MFKVLIVDDNINDREGLRAVVNWKAIGVSALDFAENGQEGLEKSMLLLPDLVLTDISMPILNGLEMAKKIREKLPKMKFVFMSCFSEVEYLKTAIDINSYGYVLKPIDVPQLEEIITKVLNIRKEEIKEHNTLKKLEQQLENVIPLAKEQFIRDLLYGNIISDDAAFSIDLCGYYTVCSIRLDDYDNFTLEGSYKYINQVKNCIESIGKTRVHIVVKSFKSLVLLMFIDDIADGMDEVLLFLNRCKEEINKKVGITATCIVGGISDSISDIPLLFKNSETVLSSKMCTRPNSVFLADDITSSLMNKKLDIQSLKDEIIFLLENNGEENIRKFIDKYFLEDNLVSESEIKGSCFMMISIIQMYLYERNESFETIFGTNLSIWNKLLKFETILDLKQWLFNVFTAICQHISSHEIGRDMKITNEIKAIIEKEYKTIENVAQIAQRVFLSVNHANFIFKGVTGESIFDYLIKVRMENAKKMLSDPHCKIYEISEDVGYKSKTYFTTVFKEYTGMTPKEYRSRL